VVSKTLKSQTRGVLSSLVTRRQYIFRIILDIMLMQWRTGKSLKQFESYQRSVNSLALSNTSLLYKFKFLKLYTVQWSLNWRY
jgi:hypothetical protein